MTSPVSTSRRLFAVGALVGTAALIAALVAMLFRHAGSVVLGLIGLALAVGGAWSAVTSRRPRRLVGAAVAAVGFVAIVAAVLLAVDTAERAGAYLAGVLVLLALTTMSARAAIVPDLYRPAVRVRDEGPPRHPVLLCNPKSGGGKVERFGLVDLATDLGVETVLLDGHDLEQLARAAVARGADCLGMAGGDGSQALVASIAVEHGLPFVCVSAGTRNHFARDLGLDPTDPRGSLLGFRDAIERRIDYATVNGRLFVNNVSLGVYAEIVRQESYRDAKRETTTALLPELLGRQAEPFDLQFTNPDGREVDGAIVLMVSNNPYVARGSHAGERYRLDTGRLGVFAVTTRTGAEAARFFTATAIGVRRRSSLWHEFAPTSFEVRSRSGHAFAGVDGEALELPTPLRFEVHPRGLTLLVPDHSVAAAAQRARRDVGVGDLVSLAAGRVTEVPGTYRTRTG